MTRRPRAATARGRVALLCVALCVAGLAAAAPARADGPPSPRPLTDGWEFKPDPLDTGRFSSWQFDLADEGWAPVTVPSVFDARALPTEFGGTVGWYRLRFTAPAAVAGFDWALRFEQVRRNATVWLNGTLLGSNEDPYVPFTVNASGLRPGAFNSLVVRVDNRKPGPVREGWWNWGGITRPVTMFPVGAARLEDLGLMSEISCRGACGARVLVEGMVRNRTPNPINPEVYVRLTSPSGAVSEQRAGIGTVPAGKPGRVKFEIPVARPELWSPDHPNLYSAEVQTLAGGAVQQVDRLRIGLRSVRVKHGLLYLNGRELELRGASIQEDVPGRGPALTDADMDGIVANLKSLGANATRAHYLLNEGLLRRFDEAGIMVWSQAANYHSDLQLHRAPGRSAALRTVAGTILAARNHPSVFTHSVANELSATPDRTRYTGPWLASAARLARRLDPTVPISLDLLSYPGYPRQETYTKFDLLGINNYFGWYKGKDAHYVGDFSTLSPYLRSMRAKYPEQAMMMTEFGAEATFAGPATVKGSFAFQSRYLKRTMAVVDNAPWLAGALYWTSREFAVKPYWEGGVRSTGLRDSIHNKGLISYDGTPKPAAAVAHLLFTRTPVYTPARLQRKAQRETGEARRLLARRIAREKAKTKP